MGARINIKKFASAFVANGGNGTEAMLATKPMKRDSAKVRASVLLKSPDVKAEIAEALKKHRITYDYILDTQKRVVETGIQQLGNMKVSPSDINVHLLGMMRIIEKTESKGNSSSKHLHLHLENVDYTDLIRQREQHSTFFNEILESEVVPPSMRKPHDPAVLEEDDV